MNYELKMRALIKEAFKFKKYKKMNLLFKILTIILEIPFIISSLIFIALFYIAYCFIDLISISGEYVKTVIRNEGKDVKHATQFIIYFFGFPFVILMTIITSFLNLFLGIYYFFVNIFGEVATLHGFKFQPFISSASEDFEINVNDKAYSQTILISFFVINYTLIILTIILRFFFIQLHYDEIYGYYYTFNFSFLVTLLLYFISMILFGFFGFENKKEDDIEQIQIK